MDFDVDARTIYLTHHGSTAYGTNTPTSDIDFKGVCIKPKECYFGFLHKFDQCEKMASKNGGVDSVVYSLEKFAAMAIDCNPNIIEVLFVDESDIVKCDAWGQELLAMRDMFISKKVRYTFAGYAFSQIKRIKTHRSWLLNPPASKPNRKDFNLSEETKVQKSELGAFEETLKFGRAIEMSKDMLTLFLRERQYQSTMAYWEQYEDWKKTRNKARAELEAKYGYDTKYAYHVIRLGRMCIEILEQGKVFVKRSDRDELLAIRNGAWSYERLLEEADKLDKEAGVLYETSSLQHSPDKEAINDAIMSIAERYTALHG